MQVLLMALKDGTTGELVPVKCDANGKLIIGGVTIEAGTVNVSSEVEIKNDSGSPIPFIPSSLNDILNALPPKVVYSSGALSYFEVSYGGKTYRQTITYPDANTMTVGAWVEVV